jgi:hypothetical protein
MRRTTTKPPADLKKPGRDLWRWIADEFTVEDSLPLVAELCRVADRLAEVRASIAEDGVGDSEKRNPLLDSEMKLSGQLGKLWRVLGLADKPEPMKRPVGRPPAHEAAKWRG